MADLSHSLASGCDGRASMFKRGGGGLAIGGGCRGGRSTRMQGGAAPILNTSGSARWFDVAGQGLKSRSCKRRPRNRNCRPRPCECKRPRPCERLTRAQNGYGDADVAYSMGYRMCYLLWCCRYGIQTRISHVLRTTQNACPSDQSGTMPINDV